MPSRKSNNNGFSSFPRAITEPKGVYSAGSPGTVTKHSGAPSAVGAVGGFVVLSLLNSVVLYLVVRVLRNAGIVSWNLSVVEILTLAMLWVSWRSIDRLTDIAGRS